MNKTKPDGLKRRVAKDIKKISGVTIAVAPLSPFLRTFFIVLKKLYVDNEKRSMDFSKLPF